MHSKSLSFFVLALAAAPTVLAALNGRCTIGSGAQGVCIHTADCSSGGGTSASGFCPNDPADVKCCTKPSCSGSGGSGDCRWSSSCSGTTLRGQCPGPADFKCCVSGGGGGSNPPSGGGGGTSTNHDLSERGAQFIAGFEGFRANFYNDAAGVKTIGYGHACQPASSCNNINAPITEAQGRALLKQDAATFVSCINKDVKVALNQNQFDALVSFAYNLGCGNLDDIAAYLNRNDFSGATSAMKQYVHAGGQVLQGLVTRRNKEVELFNS